MAATRGSHPSGVEEMEASIRAISAGDAAGHAEAEGAGYGEYAMAGGYHGGAHGGHLDDHDAGSYAGGGGAAAASAAGPDGGAEPAKLLSKEELHEMFDFYCNYGRSKQQDYMESLDSFMFMKFAKECPDLLGGAVNRTTIDLIFAKAKPKFERRLDFDHFLDALSAIAEKKYPDYPPHGALRLLLSNHLVLHHDFVRREVLKTGETEIPLTGIYKRLYDPRSYTGVYAERFRSGDGRINGDTDIRIGRNYRGSTNTGTNETVHDISVLMRPHLHGGGTMMSPVNHSSFRSRKRRDLPVGDTTPRRSASRSSALRRSGSGRSVSGRSVGGRSRSSGRAASRRRAAAAASSASRNEIAEVQMMAMAATRAGRHDEAAEILARAQALTESARAEEAEAKAEEEDDDDEDQVPEPTPGFLESLRGTAPPLDQDAIEEMFLFYCNFGRTRKQDYLKSLDSFMFMKFAKECPGLLERSLDRTSIDLIFTKAKAKGERRLTFSHFLDALSAIAEKKYPRFSAADALRLLIHRNLAPHHELVLAEQEKTGETEVPLTGIYKRLYDPRSYTGVYAERFRSGDGRINGDTDTRAGRAFTGSTNTGTDETIHDISVLMRPNLRSGTMMRSRAASAGGSPRRRPASARGAARTSRLMRSTQSSAARAVDMEDTGPARGNWYA